MSTKWHDDFICVGTSQDDESGPCVVLSTASVAVRLSKEHAEKIAVDILRSVEFLWLKEKNT